MPSFKVYPRLETAPIQVLRRDSGFVRKADFAELRDLLVGSIDPQVELPVLPELIRALVVLADAQRPKVSIALASSLWEYTLVRSHAHVHVSCYESSSNPEILFLDRRIDLKELLEITARTAEAVAKRSSNPTAKQTLLTLAERALNTPLRPAPWNPSEPVLRSGGALTEADSTTAVSFGFNAWLNPSEPNAMDAPARADLHALLFHGELWAYVRGRRMPLLSGPIWLAVQRMVQGILATTRAWQDGRPVHIRLRSGSFLTGIRLDRRGDVSLTLGTERGGSITIPALDVSSAALPVLRLASELIRTLIAVDRIQARNLRVMTLRDDIRSARRAIRASKQIDSIINFDPDRAQWLEIESTEDDTQPNIDSPAPTRFRYREQWRWHCAGLDSQSTFLCEDRIVANTPRGTFALHRDDGRLLWVRSEPASSLRMVGPVLFRMGADRNVELCDLHTGQAFAETSITSMDSGAAWPNLYVGGQDAPPIAVVAESSDRLVAIDLRNAEPRWQFASRDNGRFSLSKAGRMVLVAAGDGVVHALDGATGDLVWRFSAQARFRSKPVICHDTAVLVSGELGMDARSLFAIDLSTGRLRWQQTLSDVIATTPIASSRHVICSLGSQTASRLLALQGADGSLLWTSPDPGIGMGAAQLVVDNTLIVHSALGAVSAIQLDDGRCVWSRALSDPQSDDTPDRLEPIHRAGLLFVPSTNVSLLRAATGDVVKEALPCDLVPDFLRVDERNWVYIAEESGHIRSFAPSAHLTLVR